MLKIPTGLFFFTGKQYIYHGSFSCDTVPIVWNQIWRFIINHAAALIYYSNSSISTVNDTFPNFSAFWQLHF